MKRFTFIVVTLLIACVWTIHAASAEAILESSPVVNQAYTGQDSNAEEGKIGQISLYTATDADDFAAKLGDMIRKSEGRATLLSGDASDSVSVTAAQAAAATRLLISADAAQIQTIQNGQSGVESYNPLEAIADANSGFCVIQFNTPDDAKRCQNYLQSQPGIAYVEQDHVLTLIDPKEKGEETSKAPLLPNDPHLSWGISGTQMDVFAALLKDKGLSSRVVVAVVDTGADTSHSFIKGYLTDGHNYVDQTDTNKNPAMRDGNGHGTHVSGTIAEAIKGLNISIMPVRVMTDAGWGYVSVISEGIRYAANHGANVINLSLGGGHSSYMDEAIAYAIGKNVTVVAAAGNSNADTEDVCPAHIQNAITVAAVDSGWKRASFSNHGDAVDIAAPGVSIGSCIPGEKYASWSGTSMAAPHVSAAAALLLYQTPALTPKQVEDELCGAAIDRGDPDWDKKYYGAGTLSMQKWIPGGTLERKGKFGENDSLTWSQYSDGTFIISGQGAMPDYTDKEHAPWYDYRAGIKKVVIESGVTNIGNYAFFECGDLTDVAIPETVSMIGSSAFNKCASLESVVIPDSVITIGGSAFASCSNLSGVTFGKGLATIKSSAFSGCAKLTEVTLPNSVTSVESAAFAGCNGLTAFKIGDNASYSVVDGVLFSKDLKTLVSYPGGKGAVYSVPSGTVKIGGGAFKSAELTTVTLPDSLVTIGADAAFNNCSKLTSINLPNSLKSIGSFAFGYAGLTSIKFPDGLEKIDGYAFVNCDGLTDVAIPASVTSISGNPFYWSDNLKEFRVDKNNAKYCDVDGVLFTKDMKTLCAYPIGKTDTTYTVPDGVSIIGTDSIKTCKLSSVTIPDGVTEIRLQAFWNSPNLASVYLPSSLVKVGWAFPYCGKLKDVYYGGSAEQWKAIEIAPGDGNSNSILKATVHYSQIAAGTAEARPGESVEIPITMERNPGLTVMRLKVSYDSSVLTLEGVTDGKILGSQSHGNDYSVNPYTLYWNNHTAKTNFTADGTIATLKFKVAPGAADGDYPISVSYDSAANDILNKDLRPVSFDIANGGITVTHIRYGDVNDDKSVTLEDSAILDRYLADWTDYKIINSQNADVNTDTSVTVLDSVILARHLADWKGFETLPYTIQSNASLMGDGSMGTIQVGASKGAPGEIIPVVISLKDNPGLTMMRLYVAYDSEALELREVRDAGILGVEIHSDNYDRNPYTLFWNNGTAKNNYMGSETAVTLLFRIRDNAPEGSYPITVSYDADKGDILDCDLNPVSFQTIGGNVTVTATSAPSIAFVDVSMNPGEPDENCVTAIVSCSEPGAIVWCGMYDKSGQFIGVLSQDIVEGQTDYVFSPYTDFDRVKIFVLDSELRPLCAPMVSK